MAKRMGATTYELYREIGRVTCLLGLPEAYWGGAKAIEWGSLAGWVEKQPNLLIVRALWAGTAPEIGRHLPSRKETNDRDTEKTVGKLHEIPDGWCREGRASVNFLLGITVRQGEACLAAGI
jgi:hypothetical protein